ncbi:MAG: leucine-rich repeat domain-containing protein, partial [Bacteroidota bacterium]
MQEYFKINDQDVGFADHPTEDTFFRKGGLDTRVAVQAGKLKINLLTPRLDLQAFLGPGAPDDYAKEFAYLRLATYQDVVVPRGQYGQQLTYPTKGSGPAFEVYGLLRYEQFHGTVTVQEGYVHVAGTIRNTSYPAFSLTVEAVRCFTPKPLLPQRRRYDLPKARQADPLKVYELQVNATDQLASPDELLRYRNLEYLWFGHQFQATFTELPEAFFAFEHLHTLSFHGHALSTISPAIGQLSRLEELTLARGPLMELPETIGQLTALRSVSLEYNQLMGLPEALTTLPELRYLNLKGNKFRALPASLEQVFHVDIDRKHKKLYLDTRYQSANAAPIDHALFDLRGYPAEREQLAAKINTTPDLHLGRELLLR